MCCHNVRVSQHTAHAFNGHSLAKSQCSKRMTCAMVGDLLLYSAFRHYLFQLFAHRPIVDFSENQPVFRQILVPFDYLQGNIQQLHLERDICLMPFRQYPFLTVHLHYFVRCEFFHIHERQGGEAGENEQIPHQCEGGVVKLVRHDSFDFVLCQILPFLNIRADMELRKRISRYQSVIVRTHDHAFQPHAVQPDGGVFQSPFSRKISRKLLDEVGRKFQHGHIRPSVE